MSEEVKNNEFTFENPEYRQTYWHTCSHIMAQAVKRLWPEVKLAIGPSIDEGWYYDMDAPFAFTPEHLEKIEAEMRKICKEKLKLERFELPRAEALKFMEEKGEPFKVELINDLPEDAHISFYKQGEFTDLCAGPHLDSTGRVKGNALKLTACNAAYWRGDSNRETLQRIYGVAFPKKDELDEYLKKIEEAKKRGAIALFGEKYGETVRVVEMGDFSVEFCGGTHLDNTAKTGVFRIKSEGSVASGVRRIEATVGRQSLETMNRNQELLFQAAQVLKTTPGELAGRAEQQMQEMKQLRSALEKFKAQASLGEATQFLMAAKELGGLKVLAANRSGLDANEMRRMGDFLRDKEPGVVGVLASINGEKVSLLAVCGKEAVAKGIKAGDIIKAIAPIVGGRGGGKPDSAMGGGTELLKIDDALAAVDDFVAGKLGL